MALGLEGGSSGSVFYSKSQKLFVVRPSETEGQITEGLDAVIPHYRRFKGFSQEDDELVYVHVLRMIAMVRDFCWISCVT